MTAAHATRREKEERSSDRGVPVTERSFSTFQRSLRLPFRVDPEPAQAKFENGVLSITAPEGRQAQSQRIQIKGPQAQVPKVWAAVRRVVRWKHRREAA